jgi:PAS domain S-box-containing protein
MIDLDDPHADKKLALLAQLCAHMPMGFGLLDREFRYVLLNDYLARAHGRPRREQVGRTVAEIIPEAWPVLEPLLRRALAGEFVLNQDVAGVDHATGEPRFWSNSYFPVRRGEEFIGIGVIFNDVTDRRRAELSLAVRNDLYAMLARTNAVVARCRGAEELFAELCAIAVETGRFRCAFVGVAEGGRLKPAAFAGEGAGYLREITIPIGEDAGVRGPAWTAFRTGGPVVVNDFLGSALTKPWHASARKAGIAAVAVLPLLEAGKAAAALILYAATPGFFTPELLATLSDIIPNVSLALERIALERRRRLDEAELRLRDRAIQSASQGVVITDATKADNPMVYVSPAFERMTGYPAAELLGRNCRLLQGPGTDPAAVAELRAAIAGGRDCQVELLNYRKDGATFWNELVVSPVFGADGALTHFVGVQTDVTERRSLEEQFRQSQKMEAVGRLAGGVAHDFNNLLTIIGGSGEILLAQTGAEDPRRELVDEILKAAGRAGALTSQLLAFGRRQVLAPKVISLNDVVCDTQRLMVRLLGENVALQTKLAPDLWSVTADPGQMAHILLNLAANARDAMPRGGRLEIETSNVLLDEEAGRELRGLAPGPYVLLRVSDDGVGMDEKVLARAFEPFFTTKELGRGSGLGLSIVDGIVAQSRGVVRARSSPGRGATFSIHLPRATQPAAPPDEPPAPVSAPSGSETVLLAEDEGAVRRLAARVLRAAGYRVLEAADGEEALRVAAAHEGPIHILVSDVVMPRLGGRALAESLVALRPACRVLFLSGYTDDAVLRHGVREAEYAFLQKPFRPLELAEKVRAVLGPAA